jgi:hypothetical protein
MYRTDCSRRSLEPAKSHGVLIPATTPAQTRSRISDILPSTMPQSPEPRPVTQPQPLYCPNCAREVTDPLTCGDCSAVICRVCGTPLESADELGMG